MGIGKGKKSILEPHYPEMFSLRKQGKSYQEITDYFNEKYSMNLWKNQVYSFLKRRENKGILPAVKIRNSGNILNKKPIKNEYINDSSDFFNFK